MANVQSTGNSVPLTGPNRLEQAFGSNVGASRTIAVYISHDASTSQTPSTPTDTLNNTYVLVEQFTDVTTLESFSLWVAPCPNSGANTVTVLVSAAIGDGSIIIAEFSGRDTTSPIGAHTHNTQANPGTGANGVTCGPVTAVASDDVLMFMTDLQAFRIGTFSAGTNFTERVEVGANITTQIDSMLESWDNHSGGSVTGVATQANDERTVSMVVCLKVPGGGGGGTATKGNINLVGQSVVRSSTW